jgi:hypothetical protein
MLPQSVTSRVRKKGRRESARARRTSFMQRNNDKRTEGLVRLQTAAASFESILQ